MMMTVRRLRMLDASARMMTIVSARDLRFFAGELRHYVYRSRVCIAEGLWQVLVHWERLGRLCAMLTVRKPGMVRAWKQQIALIVSEIVSQLMRRMSSCGDARRFCARLACLSDEARRQVRDGRQLGREKIPLWDRTSPKVMMGRSPHRVLRRSGSVGACWAFRSALDVCRAVDRKLVNGEFSPAVMFGVYFL
jgi:hypothetical protein